MPKEDIRIRWNKTWTVSGGYPDIKERYSDAKNSIRMPKKDIQIRWEQDLSCRNGRYPDTKGRYSDAKNRIRMPKEGIRICWEGSIRMLKEASGYTWRLSEYWKRVSGYSATRIQEQWRTEAFKLDKTTLKLQITLGN